MTFTVASSRPGAGMRKIVETLAIGLPFASYNGGNLVVPRTWQVTSSHKMARDVVEQRSRDSRPRAWTRGFSSVTPGT